MESQLGNFFITFLVFSYPREKTNFAVVTNKEQIEKMRSIGKTLLFLFYFKISLKYFKISKILEFLKNIFCYEFCFVFVNSKLFRPFFLVLAFMESDYTTFFF